MKIKWLKPVVMTVIPVLLILCMIRMFYVGEVERRAQIAWMEGLKSKATPYEREIKKLQSAMKTEQDNIKESTVQAEVTFLLIIRSPGEVTRAEEWLRDYDFPVTLVVDAAMEKSGAEAILKAVNENEYFTEHETDIMLSGNPSEEGVLEGADQWREICAKQDVTFSQWWFFVYEQDTRGNAELLAENDFAGFSQVTDYGINLRSGELSSGLLYAEHVPVLTGDNKIESTLELCAGQKKTAAFSFDIGMFTRMDQTMADSLLEDVFTMVETKENNKDFIVHNTSQLVEQDALNKRTEEEKLAEYDRNVLEQQERLDELRSIVREIYSHWEDRLK